MKNRLLISLMLIVLSVAFSFAAGAKPVAPKDILIDNFEDGDIIEAPNWWKFDALKLKVVDVSGEKIPELGKYALSIQGKTKAWYVGGFGMYLAQPIDKYTHIQMDVYGTGEKSGMIKVELYEDDNANKQIEQNPAKNYAPTKDDRFMYEMKVDWDGWKQIAIPFAEFNDDNPGIGNDTFDPNGEKGSGGLINVQFIVVAASAVGNANVKLDNIKVVKIEETEQPSEKE